jgi:lysyl endopeptidase
LNKKEHRFARIAGVLFICNPVCMESVFVIVFHKKHPMMIRNRLFILISFCFPVLLAAQISVGGRPAGLRTPALSANIPVHELPVLDVEAALAEDTKKQGLVRFAAPLPMQDIHPGNHGVWQKMPDGGRIWQCRLRSEGALGLVLIFDRFVLPEGARFYAYSPDGRHVEGAFVQESCLPSGKFMLGVVPGETACLEYYEPAGATGDIHLNRVDYAYDAAAMTTQAEMMGPFGTSLPCNVNINCPQGANWQTQKHGVARMVMVFGIGVGYCTGTLIANTAGTFDPYFLSAHHCQLLASNPEFDLWRFDFDYEAPGCTNPGTEPAPKSVLGCERIAYRQETDFMLLKLNPIPVNYGLYFNGWSRSTTPATKSAWVHHPVGDIQKISVDTNAATLYATTINWGGVFGNSAPNTHWRTLPEIGIYQEGSSGCALFDQNNRIVGQLHGGTYNQNVPCQINHVFWGRFDLSWSAGSTSAARLREWLDPGNTNMMTRDGYAQPIPVGYTVSGNIKTWWNDTPVANVQVLLSGTATDTTMTNAQGEYVFTDVPSGGSYVITPVRDSNAINGVSTLDLLLTSKHILGIEALDSPWKIIASDANRNNSVTNFDILESRKMILGITDAYSSSKAWRFYPSFISFNNPQNPFASALPETISVNNLQANYFNANFKAVKIGDVNTSADPGN